MKITEFKDIVDSTGILSNTCECSDVDILKRKLVCCISGEIIINKTIAKIGVAVSDTFPKTSPSIFLLNQKDFVRLPHVEHDGYICYTHDDTMVLDIDNPSGIIVECIQLAVNTLLKGITRENDFEFYNEYESYWARLKGVQPTFANLNLSNKVEVIKYARTRENGVLFAASEDANRVNLYEKLIDSKNTPPQFLNGIYIPLEYGAEILIPLHNQILTITDIRDLIFKNITLDNKKKITSILKKSKFEDFIIISLPSPNGNNSLFAVRLKGINHCDHPLLNIDTKASVTPYVIKRVDPEYMIVRGGNGNSFFDKKVLVVGGGSIGSIICEELVKAGVINVDIIDREKIEIDNCYRHICGFTYFGKSKALAIKEKISVYYPHSNITAFPISVEEAILKRKVDFRNYDAIIISTGNATINQYIMRHFKIQSLVTPVLFCWLDPYGIGGHCLITNISKVGCYQCLYTNDKLHNSSSFADANQPKGFVKNISGCGSVYVPYGALDACQTAMLTIRKLLNIFSGKEKLNAIYSWKGDSELFLSQGYNLSARYNQSLEQLEANKSNFTNPYCKTCGCVRNGLHNE